MRPSFGGLNVHHHYQQSMSLLFSETSYHRPAYTSMYYNLQQHIRHKFPLDRQWKCLSAIDTKSKYWAISTWSKSISGYRWYKNRRTSGGTCTSNTKWISFYRCIPKHVLGACRYTKLLEEYWRLCTIACYNPWDFVECTFPLRPIIIQEIMFYFPLCPIILVIPEVLFYLSIIFCYSPRYFAAFSHCHLSNVSQPQLCSNFR